jgi:peptide chain release factor 1
MNFSDSDIRIDRITGSGPGGQHRNKTASCVRVTHIPTNISVTIDGRHQHKNLAKALKELERRLEEAKQKEKAQARKLRRDIAIKDDTTIRTYDYKRDTVKDHRTGKQASIKDVLLKGNFHLVAPREFQARPSYNDYELQEFSIKKNPTACSG